MDRSVVDRLAAFPDRLAHAARRASPEPPAPGEWTPAQIVRHLIAVETIVWPPRLSQLRAEDGPRWAWIEPDAWAGEPDATLDRLLDVFREARASTVATLVGFDDDVWARTGTHETYGVLDVAGLMTKAVDHDDEHLASVRAGSADDQADAPE
jgi:hypothetical protein